MDTFWTSDQHFGHRDISRFSGRPFAHSASGLDEMNEFLVDAWNRTVGPDDTVFVLGDVCMGRLDDTIALAGKLHGRKHLVAGNHDRCWGGYTNAVQSHEMRRMHFEAGFATVVDGGTTAAFHSLGIGAVTMSHFPFAPLDPRTRAVREAREYRFDQFRPLDVGQWLLHGHIHQKYRQHGRQVNVGVDAWGGRPVHQDEISELILAGEQELEPIEWGMS